VALLTAISGTPLTDIRSNANYRTIQYLCLVPNDVVVRFLPSVAPTTAVYAEITVGTVGTGSMSNIREGQTVIYSTTTDHQATEVFRTRVRKVSGTATLFVGENSQVLTTSMYVTVIDTYELREKLRRSATMMDWEITFRKLLPIETALPSAVVVSNGATSYAPTAVPKAMDASATSTFIHFWESSNSSDSVANETTASPTFTLQAAAFRWIRYTFVDSNDNTNYRVIPCWTVPKNYSSQVATGFVSASGDMASISQDAELGWSATIPAFAGIENVLNKTLCVIAADEWYNNSRQSIRTNINMVGWLQNESTDTSGSETIGRDTETNFTIEGIGHQLARLNVSSATVIQTNGTPTAWDTIQNPTPARMLTYHLSENTTLFNLCSMSIPADDTDFVGDDYTISNGKALDDMRAITEVINAELQYDTNGRLDLCRNLVYLDDTARDAAVTVVEFEQGDFTNHNIDYDYSKQTASLKMTGGAYNSVADSYVLYEADAPAVARESEGDPEQISNQVLVTDSTGEEAEFEIAQRASNFFAANNPTWTLRCTLNDEWWFLVPDVGVWFTFPLAETDTARGKVFTSGDRWQLLQIGHSTNNITGRRQVDATFRLETQSTGAMVRAAQIQNDTAADIIYYPAVLPPFVGENLEYTDGNWYDSEDSAPPSDPTPPDADCELGGLRILNPVPYITDNSALLNEVLAITVRGSGQLSSTVSEGGMRYYSHDFASGAGIWTIVQGTLDGQLSAAKNAGNNARQAIATYDFPANVNLLGARIIVSRSGGVSHGGSDYTSVRGWDSLAQTTQTYFLGGGFRSNGTDIVECSHVTARSVRRLAIAVGVAGANYPATSASIQSIELWFDSDASLGDLIEELADVCNDEPAAGDTPIYGDAFYFWQDGVAPQAYDAGEGLLVNFVQPASIPPYSDTHEYLIFEDVTSGVVTYEFNSPYSLDDAENFSIQVETCFTGEFA
jgi:hypothetical protein